MSYCLPKHNDIKWMSEIFILVSSLDIYTISQRLEMCLHLKNIQRGFCLISVLERFIMNRKGQYKTPWCRTMAKTQTVLCLYHPQRANLVQRDVHFRHHVTWFLGYEGSIFGNYFSHLPSPYLISLQTAKVQCNAMSEMMKDALSVCKVKHSLATLNMVLTPLFIVIYCVVIETEDRCLLSSLWINQPSVLINTLLCTPNYTVFPVYVLSTLSIYISALALLAVNLFCDCGSV